MKILSIETSCDETSIAIVEFKGAKTNPAIEVKSHIITSQEKLHAKFGGVVPNLAKREHQLNLPPILLQSLKEAKLYNVKLKNCGPRMTPWSHRRGQVLREKSELQLKIQNLEKILEREPELLKIFKKYILPINPPKIDAIAVTRGPGLEPALWVGINFAKALGYLWKKPVIPVNHMEGHIFSALIEPKKSKFEVRGTKHRIINLKYPAIALLVSGGHTELVYFKKLGKYKIIGETLDDAAGESFDKVARLLGLGYPGGPIISRLADKRSDEKIKIVLPRPMIHSKNFDFSFSGLKTAVLYKLEELKKNYPLKEIRSAVAREFENAAVEVLVKKTTRAAFAYKVKTVIMGGGVSANKKLRKELKNALEKETPGVNFFASNSKLSGDNALIISLPAFVTCKKIPPDKITADGNLRLT